MKMALSGVRSLVRAKEKVETEYRIAAIAYNLTRLIGILGREELEKRLKELKKA